MDRKQWELNKIEEWINKLHGNVLNTYHKNSYREYRLVDIGSGAHWCLANWSLHFKSIYATDLWNSYKELLDYYKMNQLEFIEWIWKDSINVHKIPCNCEALPFDNEMFDVATSISSIEHFGQPFKAMEEINRVLKPGKYFIFTVEYQDEQYRKKCPNRILGFNDDELKYLCNNGMWELIHKEIAPPETSDLIAWAREGKPEQAFNVVPCFIVLRKRGI